MKNDFIYVVLAMILGVSSGMLLSVFIQRQLNEHYIKTCTDKAHNQLIMVDGVLGTAYYCVPKNNS